MRDSSWRRGTELEPAMCARLYSPCSRTSISASVEPSSSSLASAGAVVSRGMIRLRARSGA